MKKVLLLNATYLPISIISVERAMTLLFQEKASIVHAHENKKLRSISQSFEYPDVIKLNKYVKTYLKKATPTRKNIFLRDDYTCQYCGSKDHLTIDHIIPVSRSGKNTWNNMVTACFKCNEFKNNRTPEEADMKLKPLIKANNFSLIKKYRRKNWNEYLIH